TEVLRRQLAAGGILHPIDAVLVPPFSVGVAVRPSGIAVPTLPQMEADFEAELPLELFDCYDDVRALATAQGIDISPELAEVDAVYGDAGVSVVIAMPAQLVKGVMSFTIQSRALSIGSKAALLRQRALSIAQQVIQQDGLPTTALFEGGYQVTRIGEFAVVSLGEGDETFNVAVRQRPIQRATTGPRILTQAVLLGQSADAKADLTIDNPAGFAVVYDDDLPWLYVEDDVVHADTQDVESGTYLATIIATDALSRSDTAIIEVKVG
ncbi:MAG: hypothetical protein AABY13_05265, partial [Nanoarchaeota archaeon]